MNTETFADNLRNKNILITGASGLICSSFIDLLMRYNEQGTHISIYAMSRNEKYAHKRFEAYWGNPLFSFICHNVIEPFSLDIPFDYMVHGASNASPKRYATDPVGTMKSNLGGWDRIYWSWQKRKKQDFYIYPRERCMGKGMARILLKTIVVMWIVLILELAIHLVNELPRRYVSLTKSNMG